jgi:hypothetical protein
MFAVTADEEFDAISGDSFAMKTEHPDKFELVPTQKETEVVLPYGLTDPFSCAASEVTSVSIDAVTVGGASVVKLNVLPETV